MGATTLHSLPFPEATDQPFVHLDLKGLAESIDPLLHRADSMTAAQRTALTGMINGYLVLETDTNRVWIWEGAWRYLAGGVPPTLFGYYRLAGMVWVSGLQDWQMDTLLPGFAAPAVGSFNTTTGEWTCGETGVYQIEARVQYRSNFSGFGQYDIDLWDVTAATSVGFGQGVYLYVSSGNIAAAPSLSRKLHAVSGHKYKVRGYNSGTSNTLETGPSIAYFTGVKVSE